jgi:transposase
MEGIAMEDHWMENLHMFEAALGIESPWQMLKWTFNQAESRLDFFIGFQGAQTLPCSVCHTLNQPYYDIGVDDQVWRHLDFWQYKTFLHAPHHRVDCTVCGKVKYAQIPWTRYNSNFTLLFDRWSCNIVKAMPVKPASRIVREHDTRLWRIVHHYVDQALEKQDLSQVRHIAIDETSAKRGHHYVTVVLDSDTRRVVFAAKSRISVFVKHNLA